MFSIDVSLETEILDLLSPYVGKSSKEIELELGESLNPDSKNYCRSLVDRMLKSSPDAYRRLVESGISVKTIRRPEGGMPRESMSFPAFRFEKILSDDWDTSDFKSQLSVRFLFVVFKIEDAESVDGKILIFENGAFWTIPESDLNHISLVWKDTRTKIEEDRTDEFITKAKNPFAHVRPHAQSASDMYEYNGKKYKKYGFWLNNDYIGSIVNSLPTLSADQPEVRSMKPSTMSECIVRILSEKTSSMPSFRLKK
jgi:DNA mismatch repair protein MutH